MYKHYLLYRLALIFVFFTQACFGIEPLKVTLQSSKISLDPGGIQDSQSWFVSRQINCQLVRSQGTTYTLDAAESIKYITPLHVVLKIKKSAQFHDGSPVTAQDVLASLDYIKRSRNILGNLFIWINKIKAENTKTISFFLKQPIPQFLKVLSSTNFTIFKKKFLYDAIRNQNLWDKPLGCGGYKVAEFNNKYIKLTPISYGLPIIFNLVEKNQIVSKEVKNFDIITINVLGNSNELNNYNKIKIFDPIQIFIGLNTNSLFWKTRKDRCNFLARLDINNLITNYGKLALEANDLFPIGTLGYLRENNFKLQLEYLSQTKIHSFPINNKSFCLAYLSLSIPEQFKADYLNIIKNIYPKTVMTPL